MVGKFLETSINDIIHDNSTIKSTIAAFMMFQPLHVYEIYIDGLTDTYLENHLQKQI